MKKCPQCNKTYDDSWAVCLVCRENLVQDGTPEWETPLSTKDNQGHHWILLLTVGLLLIVAVVGIVVVWRIRPSAVVARELRNTNIPEQILGKWQTQSTLLGSSITDTITYYPDKAFESESIISKEDNVIKLLYSGTYNIEGDKIIYVVTKTNNPDMHPVGETFQERVWWFTKTRLIYYTPSGNRWYRDRVK